MSSNFCCSDNDRLHTHECLAAKDSAEIESYYTLLKGRPKKIESICLFAKLVSNAPLSSSHPKDLVILSKIRGIRISD